MINVKTFGSTRIDSLLNQQHRLAINQHNVKVAKNRQVLKRLIRVTCHLGIHELAFRGHDESEISENKGNYVDTITMLSEFDKPLSKHLDEATVYRTTSKMI